MARVTVVPEQFTLVDFDAGGITRLVAEVAERVGFAAGTEIRVEVDERNPLGRARLAALAPVTLAVQGGAFEDPKVLRAQSDNAVVDVVGRLLFRARDRLDPAFAAAPADDDLTLAQHSAWDAYAVGRCEQAGYRPSKARRLYHFRNRHGFTDVADAAFEWLWNAQGLGWRDLEQACAETAAVRQPIA